MNDFIFTVNCILENGREVTYSGVAASTDEALGLVSEANQGFEVLEHNFTECEPVPTEG